MRAAISQFEFPIPDSHSDAGPRVVFVIDQHGIFLVKRSKASVYVGGRGCGGMPG